MGAGTDSPAKEATVTHQDPDKKPQKTFLGMGVIMGLIIGVVMGMMFDNVPLGIGAGLGLGIALSIAWDEWGKRN